MVDIAFDGSLQIRPTPSMQLRREAPSAACCCWAPLSRGRPFTGQQRRLLQHRLRRLLLLVRRITVLAQDALDEHALASETPSPGEPTLGGGQGAKGAALVAPRPRR